MATVVAVTGLATEAVVRERVAAAGRTDPVAAPHVHRPMLALAIALAGLGGVTPGPSRLCAQALNWEGPSGGIVTPFANTASPGGLTRPTVAFHLLNGGDLVGRRYQGSITLGLGRRIEVGYTRSAVTSSESDQRMLFDRGFNTFHGKVNLVAEGPWPAVSLGAMWRWQRRHLEGGLGVATKNADGYLAATRTLPIGRGLALLLNGGVRISNASLMGMAGNTPDAELLFFGAAGATVGQLLTVGAEYLQEPEAIEGVPGAELPATSSWFARLQPLGGHFTFDAAVLRLAGTIAPGFDADAEHRLMLAASYAF